MGTAYESAKERATSMAAELSPQVAGEAFGDIAAAAFMQAGPGLTSWANRGDTTDVLLKVALAIAQFKAERGKLPETLDELAPTILRVCRLTPPATLHLTIG